MAKNPELNIVLRADEIGLAKGDDDRIALTFTQSNGTRASIIIPDTQLNALLVVAATAARAADDPASLKKGEHKIGTWFPAKTLRLHPAPKGMENSDAHACMNLVVGKAEIQIVAHKDVWRNELTRLLVLGEEKSKTFTITLSKEGIWQLGDADEEFAATTLLTNSDRAVALIAATMIESRIKKAILAHSNHNAKIRDDMFGVSRPLGGFSAKVDLAYMMGIITKAAYDDLKHIAWIRNQFAHFLDVRDFSSERIKERVERLQLVETHVGASTGAAHETLLTFDPKKLPRMKVWKYDERKERPRERYIITAQLFTVPATIADLRGAGIPFI